MSRPPRVPKEFVIEIYGQRWNHKLRFMIGHLPEPEARARFGAGPAFAVAVGDGLLASAQEARSRTGGLPAYVLDLAAGAASATTSFFDDLGRIHLLYGWQKVDDRLFLGEVLRYEYPEDGRWHGQGEATLVERLYLTPEGVVTQLVDDAGRGEVQRIDRDGVDVSLNWEPLPQFGDWAGLGRLERG